MIIKENKAASADPIPAGIAQAVFTQIIDLGTQESVIPGGGTKKARKLHITWELPHETMQTDKGEKRRRISKRFTASLHKKSGLRAMLEGARGKPFTDEELKAGFDLKKVLGVNCQLAIVHEKVGDKTYANIKSVVPLGKGMSPVTPEAGLLMWEIPADGPIEFPQDLPEWLKDTIKESDEWQTKYGVPETTGVGGEEE